MSDGHSEPTVPFSPVIRLALDSRGFTLEAWRWNNFLRENMLTFQRGTVEGLIGLRPGVFVLVAIVNDRPNNGEFSPVMDELEHVARCHNLKFRVAAILNPRLRDHLLRKRGYTLIDEETAEK